MNNVSVHLEDTIEVIEEILAGGGEFRMYPRGKSMRPLIVEGRDSVVLARKPSSELRRYDMVFYRRTNGRFVLHRLMKIEKDGTYTMCGDAQAFLEYGIQSEQVIGYVRAVYHKERRISLRTPWYWLSVRVWSILLLRRCCMGVKRRIRRLFRSSRSHEID